MCIAGWLFMSLSGFRSDEIPKINLNELIEETDKLDRINQIFDIPDSCYYYFHH